MKTEKASVYDIITERIVALLESGTIPWQKPWGASAGGIAPSNYSSRKPYRGINAMLLACSGFGCPYWLTFKQAKEMGGNVRKGSKGMPVVFWKFLDKEDEAGNVVRDANGNAVKVPLLRYYTVFNLEQIEGIAYEAPKAPEGPAFEPFAQCEAIVSGMKLCPEIRHGGASAFYAPAIDLVQMPQRESFRGFAEYYSTLFHELTHATGHSKRLNRKGVSSEVEANHAFGSADYSREELVAEMGASFLCGSAGIFNHTASNSAAYISNWIKALKGDSKLVVIAAAQAQKAADFILGTKFDE